MRGHVACAITIGFVAPGSVSAVQGPTSRAAIEIIAPTHGERPTGVHWRDHAAAGGTRNDTNAPVKTAPLRSASFRKFPLRRCVDLQRRDK